MKEFIINKVGLLALIKITHATHSTTKVSQIVHCKPAHLPKLHCPCGYNLILRDTNFELWVVILVTFRISFSMFSTFPNNFISLVMFFGDKYWKVSRNQM
jgi:hypothetical protein